MQHFPPGAAFKYVLVGSGRQVEGKTHQEWQSLWEKSFCLGMKRGESREHKFRVFLNLIGGKGGERARGKGKEAGREPEPT